MIFLSGMTVSLAKVACCAGSTCVKNTDIKGTRTKGANTSNTCNKGIYTEVASDIGVGTGIVSLKCIYIEDAFICTGSVCIGAWGTGGVGAIKRLGIHLQSSQILKFKWYSPSLEAKVGAS